MPQDSLRLAFFVMEYVACNLYEINGVFMTESQFGFLTPIHKELEVNEQN